MRADGSRAPPMKRSMSPPGTKSGDCASAALAASSATVATIATRHRRGAAGKEVGIVRFVMRRGFYPAARLHFVVRTATMSHLFAYFSRMKFIRRWGLMRNTYPENVQEHS